MSWLYLALLATLLYAVVNLLDDNLLRFVYKGPYLATAFAGAFGVLPVLSLVFLRTGTIPIALALLAVLAGFLTTSYYFFYLRGLASDTPSIVIALFSLSPVTIPFLAHFIVHESLTPEEVAGFIIVLLASLLLATTDFKKFKFSKALFPTLIAVLLVDAISIITKYVYQKAPFYPSYLCFSVGMGLGGAAFFFVKYRTNKANFLAIKRSLKRFLPAFIILETTNLAAEFTLNLAISRGPVSLVKVIESGVQPVFVLAIALALYPLSPKYFREAEAGQRLRKFALMTVSIIGLVVISRAAGI